MKSFTLLVLALLPSLAWAGQSETPSNAIPLDEQGFVDAIKTTNKANILGQLGNPAQLIDVTGKNGEVIGSIWHYHYLNPSEDGDYYKTTELDFIGDQVVTVVFSMDDAEADHKNVTTQSNEGCAPSC